MAAIAPLIVRNKGPITFCSVVLTALRTPATELNPLEMIPIKPVRNPNCAFAGCGTRRATTTSRAMICIRRLLTAFQLRPSRPKNTVRLAGISIDPLSVQLGRFRPRLACEGGASFDRHGVVAKACRFLPERTRDHLLDVSVALQRRNVRSGRTVGGGTWRDNQSMTLNGLRCGYGLI